MPKISKYNKDEVYKNIMGNVTINEEESREEMQSNTESVFGQVSEVSLDLIKLKKTENDLDGLVHKSYYITKRHVKALKIRTAMTDKPEEKDFSAIVRAALDLYLADTLKDI